MLSLITLAVVFGSLDATITHFTWRDCASSRAYTCTFPHMDRTYLVQSTYKPVLNQRLRTDPADADTNRPVQFKELAVSPVPLVSPGKLHLHAKVVITKPIQKFQLKLDVNRHSAFGKIHIPCTNNTGSCTHEGCTIIKDMLTGSQEKHDVAVQIQRLFTDNSFTYTCPVPAQTLEISADTINLPQMRGLGSVMADGDYTIEARLLNTAAGELYGCLTFDISIKHHCIGWACIGRRRRR